MEDWQYQPPEDLDQTLVERLRRFPREPDMLTYGARIAAACMIRAWLRIYHRLTVTGRENLPTNESFILVSNHTSHLDTPMILSALPLRKIHRVFPAAAQDFFFVNLPRLAVASVIINALPFDRKANFRHSIQMCQELLKNEGNVLLLFPEGTRTVTGELGEFKAGVGLMLAGMPYPVVPCYVDGAFRAWPKGKRFPRPRRVRLTIGQPRRYAHLKCGKKSALEITADLRESIESLASK